MCPVVCNTFVLRLAGPYKVVGHVLVQLDVLLVLFLVLDSLVLVLLGPVVDITGYK